MSEASLARDSAEAVIAADSEAPGLAHAKRRGVGSLWVRGYNPTMAKLILFEDGGYANLLPLTYWRSVVELRIGRRIVLDQLAQTLETPVGGVWTRDWVARVTSERCMTPANQRVAAGDILVNARWLPEGRVAFSDAPCVGRVGEEIAFVVCSERLAEQLAPVVMLGDSLADGLSDVPSVPAGGSMFRYVWDLVSTLSDRLKAEWRDDAAVIETEMDSRVIVTERARLRIGERSVVHPTAVLDASSGPIFISHDVTVGAGCVIDGPAYIGPGARINPRAWLHGGNAIGPVCKIGGEVDGCIISGYSNKQHEGFLGHAFVGCWVNLGAGTSNSDLKNTYGPVSVPLRGRLVDTGLQFFGAIIGDHVKIGINATIPTGAVIGFGANVVMTRPMPKYVPSFAWVTDDGATQADPAKLADVAAIMMKRRNMELSEAERALFASLPKQAKRHEAEG